MLAAPIMQDEDDATDILLKVAAELVPAMKGTLGPLPDSGWVGPGGDNGAELRRLCAALVERHPEAGRAFAAVRSWTWLTWQPVILGVIAVHGAARVAPISAMGQRVGDAEVVGYCIPHEGRGATDTAECIRQSGEELRALAELLLDELNTVARMKPVIAFRLLADRLLGTLSHLRHHLPGADTETVEAYADAWMSAAGLSGMSGLKPLEITGGRFELVLDRKACCLEYLKHDGQLCASCPKLAPNERAARMRQAWLDHG
ncbi:siderophore ferric iron reductase [Mesorhizobium xinjiangense]|uniref:siderophore ferric iron reductase n=1 Tax=Mesorhizobium xinjiangense TaxID=2678685 RepID=UPI0012EE7586|nr:siderophore ferric iron reductase [Mesorhizobium xinjiangense]